VHKKALILLLIFTMVFSLAGCKKGPKEKDTTTQLGNLENVESDETYVDSEANAANSDSESPEITGYPPVTYLSIEDVPEGTYAIEHTKEDGSVVYYRLYDAWGGHATYDNRGIITGYILNIFNVGERREGAYNIDPTRFCWVKSDYDETCIPTMYENDKLIYKSINTITDGFALERFSDEGYTIGLAGLIKSNSGNYIYNFQSGYSQPDSDTVNIDDLGANEIYLVSVGKDRVTDENVSPTGFIKGLTKNKNYICDVRTGTISKQAAFKANIHVFVSLEQYMISKFYFSNPLYIEISLEKSMPTGYYSINGVGLFRYITSKDSERESELTAADYNIPFIAVDESGYLISTVDGYAFDENGYITKNR
jgi:hypothetical protein